MAKRVIRRNSELLLPGVGDGALESDQEFETPYSQPKPIVHRDQVHGDVHYDPLSAKLLNTSAMQRLGRIYQLGYAHLVFRGGTHTRLSHVMGASHTATEIVDKLRFNYTKKTAVHPRYVVFPRDFLPCTSGSLDERWDVLRHLVAWAALLHDLGHVPLGHTLEDEFEGIFQKHDDFRSPRSPHLWGRESEIHQILTDENLHPASFKRCGVKREQVWQVVMLICFFKDAGDDGHARFKAQLEKGEPNSFLQMLREAHDQTAEIFRPYMADIVGNTICADYLDYLRRDPLNVGLDVLREIRVLSSFYVCVDPASSDRCFRMALALVDRHGKARLDVCTSVVELVRQRYRFAEIIYYHKAKVSASAMFAKAMSLIGQPPEIGKPRRLLYKKEFSAEATAESLLDGKERVESLKDDCVPKALLDSEIGDEGLHALLLSSAFQRVEKCVNAGERDELQNCLRGIAMLQAISDRQLHKVCFSISFEQFGKLTDGLKETEEVEKRLAPLLTRLRSERGLRDKLELEMTKAAGWPIDSLLLYVPPRKSQAKGIETFAFTKDGVVRLGNHPAVSAKVHELGKDYKALWRLLLLVHPEYREEVTSLSRAVDVLVCALWTGFAHLGTDERLHSHGTIDTLQEAAWFPYIPVENRGAAELMQRLSTAVGGTVSRPISWDRFIRLPILTTASQGSLAPDDHAQRAYLVERLMADNDQGSSIDQQEKRAVAKVRSHFAAPGMLAAYDAPAEVKTQFHYDTNVETGEQQQILRRAFELDDLAERLKSGTLS
ncbi:HD domain-containing protein [Bradyrhizobium sp. U531]|uniref:HD domain-containing protein n=1 Tax=Bradyrhizobium sp. U531 TaxID=3053458 RepID=UPI003F41F96F